MRKPDVFLSISRHAYQEGFAMLGPHTAESWPCDQRLTNLAPVPYPKGPTSCPIETFLYWKRLRYYVA